MSSYFDSLVHILLVRWFSCFQVVMVGQGDAQDQASIA
jgi:hypothetical protein